MKKSVSLYYLFKSFIKIGSLSWCGHMSLISMARRQFVEKDQIITDDLVVESISLASILPGPLAVNIVAYWGYKIRGWIGSIVSATAVLLPAFIGLLILSYLYFKYYTAVPALKGFFLGVMPAVAAIIFSAGISMCRKQKPDILQWGLIIASALLSLYLKGYWTSLIMISSGALIGMLCYRKPAVQYSATAGYSFLKRLFVFIGFSFLFFTILFLLSSTSFKKLEMQFVFISLTQLGGGYVVIPAMEKIFVESLQWVSHQEFIDGIALSQITPGPIFTIAGFIGYKMHGILGSLIATFAVFSPSALLMIAIGSIFEKIQNVPVIKAAFKGIFSVAIGMIFSAAILILINSKTPFFIFTFFLVALYLLINTKLSSSIILITMGILGLLLFSFQN